jgi:hypothetical protein
VNGRAIGAAFLYFAFTFAAGFALAPVRILVLEPRIGARAAELAELPVMLGVSWLAASWTVRRFAVQPTFGARSAMGALALALMLVAEFALVLPLRGMTIADYFATRDPVSGAAYYAALVVMGLMPLAVRMYTPPRIGDAAHPRGSRRRSRS